MFKNNKGTLGGGIYIKSKSKASIIISNTTFLFNHAQTKGGGIYFDTKSSTMIPKLQILACSFEGNHAGVAGGGLYWNYIPPIEIRDVKFINNSAALYGPDVASYSFGIMLLDLAGMRRNRTKVLLEGSSLLGIATGLGNSD